MSPSQAGKILGKIGGKSRSPAKQAAARKNGKKGGRPRKTRIHDNIYTLASLRARMKGLGKL